MNIKLSIPVLQALTNNEAFTYFCTLIAISKNPDSTIKDIVRITGVSETTIFNHLKKFEKVANLIIDRTGIANNYSYIEPTKQYIIVDSSLLDVNVDRNVIGFLVRFKCWTRIATNIVDLSLNRIVHEIGVQHNTVYSAMSAGLIDRGEKKLYFTLLHPALTILD
jgi:hypothetical protein